jgi:2-polyprenyl-3-methyl-5-hydroxy-6-metoxy-1,4-benzoquinol methylase
MHTSFFDLRKECPICESASRRELYNASFSENPVKTYLKAFYSPQGGIELSYLKDARFIVDECNQCGLVYQRLIPNDCLMKKLYEHWIDPERAFKLKVSSLEMTYYSRMAREIEMVINHFEVKPYALKVLDFGMGWGEWCRMARAYGCSAFGVELSRARIEYARSFGISVITWDEIPEHQFDFINSDQVFEHIPRPLDTLRHLAGSLKTGGIIRISVPNGWNIKRRLELMDWEAPKASKNSLNPIAPLEHINCFSSSSIDRMAQMACLAPVKLRGRMKLNKRALELTLRDVAKPLYHWVSRATHGSRPNSIDLFFKRLAA